ncbi:coiled-coil alpha-helical rod protein 1-like isoform X2 [Corticium candelabrum]|uniref:coiled-coil alpha-helical rod protein 1-like isoform X2 n=1 Tax=Corticium candelabrum TaxID=121492 RepID=UPI002E2720D2|nr:coiled-coil alpha-helical rod protein 1-like isoform X2 [Corticium candelabrum]
MAAHSQSLQPPHLFFSRNSSSRSTNALTTSRQLLPPSMYTMKRKTTEEPWSSLARTTNDILELKEKNQRLRRELEDLRAAERRHDSDIDARRSLLSAAESKAQRLERQLVASAEERRDIVSDMETRFRKREEDLLEEIRQQNLQLEETREERMRSVTMLERKLEEERGSHQAMVSEWQTTLATNQQRCEQEIEETKQLSERKGKELDSNIERLEEELRRCNCELEDERQTVQQLRSYIGTSLPSATDNNNVASVLEEENATLKIQLQKSEVETDSFRSTVELLNVRLASLSEIVNIQQSELSKSTNFMMGEENKMQTLLTKWREKVFALLVQQKSREIEASQRRAKSEKELSEMLKEVRELQTECEVQKHSLADRTAQLELQRHQTQKLEDSSKTLQEENASLTCQRDTAIRSLNDIKQQCQSLFEWLTDRQSAIQCASVKLQSIEQRVVFATGRISLLRGLYNRQEAVWKSRMNAVLSNQSNQLPESTNDETSDEASDDTALTLVPVDHLRSEVVRLTSERDSLLLRLEEDAAHLEERLQSVREQYETQLQDKTFESNHFRNSLTEERIRTSNLESELEESRTSVVELQQSLASFQSDMTNRMASSEKKYEESLREAKLAHAEQLSDVVTKLQTSEAELTKTAAELFHIKRQTVRDTERTKEQFELQIEELERQLRLTQDKLRSVQSEKNILTTLKQEELSSRSSHIKESRVLSSRENIGDSREQVEVHQPEDVRVLLGQLQSLSSELRRIDVEVRDKAT